MGRIVLTRYSGSWGQGDVLTTAVVVKETKTQWTARELDLHGNETKREFKVNIKTGKQVGYGNYRWHVLTDPETLPELLAAERERREQKQAKRDAQQAAWEAKLTQVKSVLSMDGWVSEELGVKKASCVTPRHGLVVMVYTVEEGEDWIAEEKRITVHISGYYRAHDRVSDGQTSTHAGDEATAVAAYLATWHWD